MADQDEEPVQLTINGREISAPRSLTVIRALWHAGYPRVKSVGCLEGVCGSCRVMVRRADSREITTELGCQVLIEEGMEVTFLAFPTPTHHSYQLDSIANSWEVQKKFHDFFPEADNCRNCQGCVLTCPRGVNVQQGVELAAKGRFREAGELFGDCVMCDLCQTACPESIAPNHVGMFARRVTSYFHTRPANLINRLEKMRKGDLEVHW